MEEPLRTSIDLSRLVLRAPAPSAVRGGCGCNRGHRRLNALPVLPARQHRRRLALRGMRSEAGVDLSSEQSIGESGARFGKKCRMAIGLRKAAASTTVSSIKSEIIVAADSAASGAIEGRAQDGDGATELMAELDSEEARAIIDPALRLMIDTVRRYGGHVVQSTATASSRCSAEIPSGCLSTKSSHVESQTRFRISRLMKALLE